MKYLGMTLERPKIAIFGFTGCQGCQLQIANKEETLKDLFSLVEVVNFREISSEKRDDYEIAFIEGSITTDNEVARIKKIRKQAGTLVAIGACACLGCVNNLKSRFPAPDVVKEVYDGQSIETGPVRPVKEVVHVDIELPGCPISKPEFEWLVSHLVLGVVPQFPKYPVCIECKQRLNACVFDMGIMCLGPITRAGCNAVCPRNRFGCWGCRGPSEEVNVESLMEVLREKGFDKRHIDERMRFFNAFPGIV